MISSIAAPTCTSRVGWRALRCIASGRCRSGTSRSSTSSRGGHHACSSRSSARSTSSVGSVAVVLLSPVMLVAAIAIKLTDGGPVFYRHDRVGRGGPSFTCFKFRSMRETNPEDEAPARGDEPPERPAVQGGTRPSGHPRRGVPPGVEHRRAPAAVQRPQRDDEPRGAPPGAAVGDPAVRPRAAGALPGAARHHRPLAGRGAGQPASSPPTGASTSSTSRTGRSGSTSPSCCGRSRWSWPGPCARAPTRARASTRTDTALADSLLVEVIE